MNPDNQAESRIYRIKLISQVLNLQYPVIIKKSV